MKTPPSTPPRRAALGRPAPLAAGRVLVALCSMMLLGASLPVPPARGALSPCVAQPASTPPEGLSNVGFETGDLIGWGFGAVTQGVCVTEADPFTAPYEGQYMARLGSSAGGSFLNQPIGPNTIVQEFVVTKPTEAFAYNLFTYDYTGFDDFRYSVSVVAPSSGEVIVAFQQGAWGSGTNLKTSGWKYAEIDLADHLGETVQLSISAGGTRDNLYAFWAYIDSAESGPPTTVGTVSNVDAGTGSVTFDPQTEQTTIAMPFGAKSDVTIESDNTCPDGAHPLSVRLKMGPAEFTMTETPPGSSHYVVTIPANLVQASVLTLLTSCPDAEYTNTFGSIVLYDPSGIVTDAVTGLAVEGAQVTLYKVPGWSPGPGGPDAQQCQNDGGPWIQPAPTDLGVVISPYGNEPGGGNPEISPDVNPFITTAIGYYGWDVAAGCWYVVVQADGYQTLTSPVVGVPPPVTNLDLALNPIGVCGNGIVDGGEQCDDGNTLAGDCCAPDCTAEPSGGACADDGDACTSDTCNDTGTCSHASLPDADADAVCDAQDVCTNVADGQAFLAKTTLAAANIGNEPTPGNDQLRLAGTFRLAASQSFQSLDPSLHGARLLVEGGSGANILDVTLPPGQYAGAGSRGWKANKQRTQWQYLDKTESRLAGIEALTATDGAKGKPGGLVRVILRGKKADYAVAAADAPLAAVVVLGDQSDAAAGRCGEVRFDVDECAPNRKGTSLTCKR